MHRGNLIAYGSWLVFALILIWIGTVNLALAVILGILLGGTALVALEGKP